MLVSGMIYILSWFTKLFDLILPSWVIPDDIMTAVDFGFSMAWYFNEIFPINACIKVFLLMLTFEFSLLLVKLVFGLISYIRGGGHVDI